MREPRLKPLGDDELSEEQDKLTRGYRIDGDLYNVFRVGVRNTDLFAVFKPFGLYTMVRSQVPPRLRELAILRIAWRNHSDYEWGHHVRMSAAVGLTPEEQQLVKQGPDAPGWSKLEAAVIRAADQFKDDADFSDDLYATLLEALGERQLTDLVYTIGNYAMVSTALNIFRVPLEAGMSGIDGD